MKAELTISQLSNNASLMKFFFRTQSAKTFEELIESVNESKTDVYKAIEKYIFECIDFSEYEKQPSTDAEKILH